MIKPYKLVVEKLLRRESKFITREELETDCIKLNLDYIILIKYLIRHKYLERIFKGIFYVYSLEERKLGKLEKNIYEIISFALEIKKVKNWYFGLETALKMNNLTHEYYTTIFVINDMIFRAKPINIMNYKVKFYKTNKLFSFGIINDVYTHSDPERTILDMIYFKKIKGLNEYEKKLSKDKLKRYVINYNLRTQKIII
jgi:predicted transcriptional regulator of viral defense system